MMIELILLQYLAEQLNGVPVCMEIPKNPPPKFVLLEKTSSAEDNHILSATVAFQSYAPTMYEAAMLNETVKAAVRESIALPQISKAKLNADYNYTDTASKRYRYQAVFDFVHF